MKNKLHTYYRNHPLRIWMIASLLTPVLILSIYYIAMEVYPFGDNTTFAIDLGQQYIDFFQYYADTLSGNVEGLTYSFTKGMGGSMLGTWSYYLMSPFLLITLLFPQSQMAPAVAVMVLAKIGTAGLSFQYMLGRMYKDADWKTYLFSVSYALIAFVSTNIMNVIWLDAIAFLPLAVWGLEKLMRTGNWHTYTLWLTVIIVTNYYMAYMVAIFLVMYFIYSGIANALSKDEWLDRLKTFTLGSLLAGGLSAFLLLPTLHSLDMSKGATERPPLEFIFTYPPQEIFSKFILGSFNIDQMELGAEKGMPNLYIGTAGTIMSIHYFFNQRITKKEKWIAGGIIAFFLLSFNIDALNIIWHGLQYPVSLPYRFVYLFSFFLLFIGYHSLRERSFFTIRFSSATLMGIGAMIAYILVTEDQYSYIDSGLVWITFGLYAIFLLLYLLLEHYPKVIGILLVGLTIIEISASTYINLLVMPTNENSPYVEFVEEMTPVIDELRPNEDEFYRIEKTFARSFNDTMQLNYYGISHFNSTLERQTIDSLGYLGLPISGNTQRYASNPILADALLGIRYILVPTEKWHNTMDYYTFDEEENVEDDNLQTTYLPLAPKGNSSQYMTVNETEDFIVYRNPYALPIGYGVSDSLVDIDITKEAGALERQNELIKHLTNTSNEPHTLVDNGVSDITLTNMEIKESTDDAPVYRTTTNDEEEETSITYHLQFEEAGFYTIEWMPNNISYLTLDGVFLKHVHSSSEPWVFNVRTEENNETKELTVTLRESADEESYTQPNVYRSDVEIQKQIARQLNEQPFQIEHFSQTAISGQIETTQKDQYVMFSIPHDKGWTALVNGEEKEIEPLLGGGFSGISLPDAGAYEIELSYSHPGLTAGIVLSALSAGIFGYSLYQKKKRK